MHRAFEQRGYIDDHLNNFKHSLHCQDVLLNTVSTSQNITTQARVIYPRCMRLSGLLF
jgi:hypothetical protein